MRTAGRTSLALLLTAAGALATAGCAPRARPALELDAVEGLTVVEYDGLLLHVRADTRRATLLVAGQPAAQADLRPGERFTLLLAGHEPVVYQLLLASEQRATFKRIVRRDATAAGGPLETSQDVVAVSTYNFEQPDRRPTPGETLRTVNERQP